MNVFRAAIAQERTSSDAISTLLVIYTKHNDTITQNTMLTKVSSRPMITFSRPARHSSRVVKTRLSPASIDMMNHFAERSLSTSIFLSVLFIGKIVTDLAEKSVVAERDYDSGSDDDGYDADDDLAKSSRDYYDSDYDMCGDAYYSDDEKK